MKTKLLGTASLIFLMMLCSCGSADLNSSVPTSETSTQEESDTSKDSEKSPSAETSSLPDSSKSTPDSEITSSSAEEEWVYSEPKSLEELYQVIYHNRVLEGSETSSATKKITTTVNYTTGTQTKITDETLTMYDNYSYTVGSESTSWSTNTDIEAKNYTYWKGVKGSYYYQIKDYEDGKENDSADKFEIVDSGDDDTQVLSSEVDYYRSMCVSYQALVTLDSPLETYLGDQDITATEENDVLIYDVILENVDSSDEYGSMKLDYSFHVEIDKEDGFLYSYTFETTEKTIESTGYEVFENIKEEYSITRGNYSKDSVTYTDPDDYWLSDYEIGFWYSKNFERVYVDADQLPIGEYIYAYAKTVTPEKALDTDLTAVSSTDEDVVFLDGGQFKVYASGTCDLTVKSDSGLEKTITVSTAKPEPESVFFYWADQFDEVKVGDSRELTVTILPTGADQDYTFTSSDTSVVKVSIIDGTPYLIAVGEGTATITCTSNADETISYSKEITVYPLTEDKTPYLTGNYWTKLYQYSDSDDIALYFYDDGSMKTTLGGVDDCTTCTWTVSTQADVDFEIQNIVMAGYTYNCTVTMAADHKSISVTYVDVNDGYTISEVKFTPTAISND